MSLSTIAWVIAAVVGLFAGGFVLHFPGSYGEPSFGVTAGIFGFVLGAANGAAAGVLLGLAIRAPWRVVGRLAGAMALSIGVTHALFDGSSTVLPMSVYALLAGVAVAGTFARLFDERSPRSMAVIGLAWALGIVADRPIKTILGLYWGDNPIGWSMEHAATGVIVALAWGIPTALMGLPDRLRTWSRSA